MKVHGQVDHTRCGELTNQDATIGTCLCIGTLVGQQEPRTTNECVNGESSTRFEAGEVRVHAHLLNVARAIGIFRTNGEPAVVLQRRKGSEKRRVDGLCKHRTHCILIKGRRHAHHHWCIFKGIHGDQFVGGVVKGGVHAVGCAIGRFSHGLVFHANEIGEGNA